MKGKFKFMIELEQSKCGVMTLKYDNKYIHSKYDPIRESEQFIKSNEELLKEKVIVIYGLGLGYHVNAILKRKSDNPIIYIFEWNDEVINYCKKYNNDIFTAANVKIISGKDENFYSDLAESLKVVKDIIIHKPSLAIIMDSNKELYTLIRAHVINKMLIEKNAQLLIQNFEANRNTKYKNIKELINKFKLNNKTFIITASGPSLDKELELLRENREKFVIISVGSSLRSVMKNNIKPDIMVIIEGNEGVKNQLENYENENIPLCFLSTASRRAVESYKGPKYMFFNGPNEDDLIINTGKTVAVAAIDIAIKCEAKEIVLLGQDLAFINGISHTETFQDMYGEDDLIKKSKDRKVLGVCGNMLQTNEGYLYFKSQIERLIKDNSKINFINCSKGAVIKGANHMDFKSYIDNYKD